ncbi:MAG: thioredoxin [Phocaeicola sp.]
METFNELISSSDVPVIVDFFAEWCGPCKTMSPILKQVKDMQGDKVRIVKVDVDKNNALAMQYSIQAVPTLMIFKNGKQMWRQSGVINAGELNKIVEMFK